MTYVALAALVAIIVLFVFTVKVLQAQIADANGREKQTRQELLSVLGKTETIALNFNDERPARGVKYIDDAEAVRLEKRVARDEA